MRVALTKVLMVFIISGCSKDAEKPGIKYISFGQPQKVNVLDYDDHIMEPFLSPDGSVLFFNNLNHSSVNTNLYFATKINDSVFQYHGEVKGVNTEFLEGVPSMDSSNVFYFISTRSYDQTLCTIYKGDFVKDSVRNVQLVSGLSNGTAGWVNFDVEVSKDGNALYFADGLYDANGGPYASDLIFAEKADGIFQRTSHLMLQHVNTEGLEYGACISSNCLELYFTRVEAPLTDRSAARIYVSTRTTVTEPFGKPYCIENIPGFVEAPTLSSDDQVLYYHKKEGEIYVLYLIRKE